MKRALCLMIIFMIALPLPCYAAGQNNPYWNGTIYEEAFPYIREKPSKDTYTLYRSFIELQLLEILAHDAHDKLYGMTSYDDIAKYKLPKEVEELYDIMNDEAAEYEKSGVYGWGIIEKLITYDYEEGIDYTKDTTWISKIIESYREETKFVYEEYDGDGTTPYVWYDDQDVKITCTGYGFYWSRDIPCLKFKFIVENNTNKAITAGMKNDAANSWYIDTSTAMFYDLPAGMKLQCEETILLSKCSIYRVEDIESYECDLWIDFGTWYTRTEKIVNHIVLKNFTNIEQ